jgi:hypothetical protein
VLLVADLLARYAAAAVAADHPPKALTLARRPVEAPQVGTIVGLHAPDADTDDPVRGAGARAIAADLPGPRADVPALPAVVRVGLKVDLELISTDAFPVPAGIRLGAGVAIVTGRGVVHGLAKAGRRVARLALRAIASACR